MSAGLEMAGRGPDRDGLKLDQLHLSLGPVLADWPTGLMLRITLQGDVIQGAHAVPVGTKGATSFWTDPWWRAAQGEAVTVAQSARLTAARRLDSLGRFLAVAGCRTLRVRRAGCATLGLASVAAAMRPGADAPLFAGVRAGFAVDGLCSWSPSPL